MDYYGAKDLVKLLIANKQSLEEALQNSAVPPEFRDRIFKEINSERNVTIRPVGMITNDKEKDQWVKRIDRSDWNYWPVLRDYLIENKKWEVSLVRSLDDITDKILNQLSYPYEDNFDIKGLVLGHVQSGKTANYTALIAKAADVGYRLIIVLTGLDNGLRLQTQIRLKHELIGYEDYEKHNSVPLPKHGFRWHEFTKPEINGDFQPGYASHAALQGSQPVLLVVKKNYKVLDRLIDWLKKAPEDIKQGLPLLIIDDEADQASIDTFGSYVPQETDEMDEDECIDPSSINARIRSILLIFRKKAYIGYTATPFANVLIPHDAYHTEYQEDLYPKDFIISLPKPKNYFGAEELFGFSDDLDPESNELQGLDVIINFPEEDFDTLQSKIIPDSLNNAIMDFVLSGAAVAERNPEDQPSTMLIHTSRKIEDHGTINKVIEDKFMELKDEWRYNRNKSIKSVLSKRWEDEFRPKIRNSHLDLDCPFENIEQFIGPFFESVVVKTINSKTGDVLDYRENPNLKAIAIGGDRLSRGLTLEGLKVSYFSRKSKAYDTLMQMGRWFGYRTGYEDLTRIYTTEELATWFSDLALAEKLFRDEIIIYEEQAITPMEFGPKILKHPDMKVTSSLKRRYAQTISESVSFSEKSAERIVYPFDNIQLLKEKEEKNLFLIKEFLNQIENPCWDLAGPVWTKVPDDIFLEFLKKLDCDCDSGRFDLSLIIKYIENMNEKGELQSWTVAVRGLKKADEILGSEDWGLTGGVINKISRTRIPGTNSLGSISQPVDESTGFSEKEHEKMQNYIEKGLKQRQAARNTRDKNEGLFLIYPISKYSGHNGQCKPSRIPLYTDPDDSLSCDLTGIAFSFPRSKTDFRERDFIRGTAPGSINND